MNYAKLEYDCDCSSYMYLVNMLMSRGVCMEGWICRGGLVCGVCVCAGGGGGCVCVWVGGVCVCVCVCLVAVRAMCPLKLIWMSSRLFKSVNILLEYKVL